MPADTQPLTSLQAGGAGTVAEIKVPPEHRGRILEMGLLVGTLVELVRFAQTEHQALIGGGGVAAAALGEARLLASA